METENPVENTRVFMKGLGKVIFRNFSAHVFEIKGDIAVGESIRYRYLKDEDKDDWSPWQLYPESLIVVPDIPKELEGVLICCECGAPGELYAFGDWHCVKCGTEKHSNLVEAKPV